MTRVYLDRAVVALEVGEGGAAPPGAAPAALEALEHLADGNHDVVLLGRRPAGLEGLPLGIREEPVLPNDPGPGWLITDDPDGCARRPKGLQTILIGPKRAPTNRPTARCDIEARDLAAAVMEILTREAMS